MLALKKCQLTCSSCGKVFSSSKDLEADTWSDNRGMGEQIGYTWIEEGVCPQCNLDFNFQIDAYEYPIGILDFDDCVKSEGVVVDYDVELQEEIVDDYWDESWNDIESTTFDEFEQSIQNIRDMLNSDLAATNQIFLKMLDAYAVTAMEAYLSGSLIKKVKENPGYMLNAAQKILDLNDVKLSLVDALKDPCISEKTILAKLYEFMYHNLPKIKNVYEQIFGVKIDYKLAELMKIVSRRHDIVHRGGKSKEGEKIVVSSAMIESDLNTISNFVGYIDSLIN